MAIRREEGKSDDQCTGRHLRLQVRAKISGGTFCGPGAAGSLVLDPAIDRGQRIGGGGGGVG
jgi:hypothetical protein